MILRIWYFISSSKRQTVSSKYLPKNPSGYSEPILIRGTSLCMPSVNPCATRLSFVLQQMQVNTVDPTSGIFFLLPLYEGPIPVSIDMAQP